MKTIPISLIAAGLFIPALSFAQDQPNGQPPPPPSDCCDKGHCPDGPGGRPKMSFEDFWKKIDKDNDGFISQTEFNAFRRVQNLSEEKRTELFNRADENKDGKLSPEEFRNMRGILMFEKIDTNHDGFISKEEFNAIPRLQKLPQEKRDEIFNRLDKDKDGKLTAEELKQMGPPHFQLFRHIHELVTKNGSVTLEQFKADPLIQKLPPEKQEALFRKLDTNGDGKITPDDKPNFPHHGPHHPGAPDGPDAKRGDAGDPDEPGE